MPRGVYIEFAGLPGSGKTTIAKKLADLLSDKGLDVFRSGEEGKLQKLINARRVFFSCPSYSGRARGAVGFNSPGAVQYIKRQLDLYYVLGAAGKSKQWDVVVSDQGIVQSFASLSGKCDVDIDLSNLLAESNEICGLNASKRLLVYVDLPVDVSVERLLGRSGGRSRADKISNVREKKEYLEQYGRYCECVRNSFSSAGCGDVLIVSSLKAPEMIAKEILLHCEKVGVL